MKDKFLIVGSIAGIFGAMIAGILAIVLNATGIMSIKIIFLNSLVFLPKHLTETIAGNFLGFAIHIIIGAAIGIIFMYFFPLTDDNYLLYKGILLGGISWLFIGGLLGTLLRLPIQDNLLDITFFMLINLAFGISTVFSANYLRKRDLV